MAALVPSLEKVLRVSNPDDLYPDSYQAILPVVDMPRQGIQFPGSEFLAALDDLDTGATFDFAIHLTAQPRGGVRSATTARKSNIDDQFDHASRRPQR